MTDRFASAQLCFGLSHIYGAIGTLERDHRTVANGWDSPEAERIGSELERIAVEVTKLSDDVTSLEPF